MSPTEICLRTTSPVGFTELADEREINAALMAGFLRENAASDVKRTHMFGERFENIYIDQARLPELQPVIDLALAAARQHLGTRSLRYGFWFNEMLPGHRTTLHAHEEMDECLSAVYYVACTEDSGRLVLHDDDCVIAVTPRPGLLVLFPPDLPHEVETNHSDFTRLSVAFNFGPLNSET